MANPAATSMVPAGAGNTPGNGILVEVFDGPALEWDGFAVAQSGSLPYTHCHLYGWRRVMETAMGHHAPYLAARDSASGTLRGILPLVHIRSLLFGRFLVSMPFLNYGGPLGDEAAVAALMARAESMAREQGIRLLELRSRREIVHAPHFDVSHRKITVLMDCAGGSEALWRRLPSKVRSQIRRPTRDGVSVRIGADQVGAFYEVFARHMRDLGTPVMPRRFFELAAEQFADTALFAVAYLGGEPIACGAGFWWGHDASSEFEIVWASALRAHNRTSANMLVYWELMKHIADAGIHIFNFGRCTPGGNTHRFKTQWGTTDEQLWWYDFSPTGALPPAESSATTRRATTLWSHIPLPLANFLGPRIVRLIPL